jgi:hypothetical protein
MLMREGIVHQLSGPDHAPGLLLSGNVCSPLKRRSNSSCDICLSSTSMPPICSSYQAVSIFTYPLMLFFIGVRK